MNKPSTAKHPISVYSVMMIVSSILILLSLILMLVEWSRWGFNRGTRRASVGTVVVVEPTQSFSTQHYLS